MKNYPEKILIKNVNIFSENGTFKKGSILVCGKKIGQVDYVNMADHSCSSMETNRKMVENRKIKIIDGHDGYCFPGMIDMHFHGCINYDFCDGTQKAFEQIASYEAQQGVTAICPATMTLPVNELEKILQNAARFQEREVKGELPKCAQLVGIQMEGPFVSPKKKGAQDERYMIPWDKNIVKNFYKVSSGLVKIVGIAPEEHDIESLSEDIKEMKEKIHFAIAHSSADYETAKQMYRAGVCHVVHLYNAMTGLHHRNPGIVGATYDTEHVTAELICDGVHVHPAMINLTFKILGKDRIVMISDSMRATGMQDGKYTLGGLDVNVNGKKATLVSDGSIAGSVTTLPDCVRFAVNSAGVSLEAALCASIINPAMILGIDDIYGKIKEGYYASIVIWDKDLQQKFVLNQGKIIYEDF